MKATEGNATDLDQEIIDLEREYWDAIRDRQRLWIRGLEEETTDAPDSF